MRSRLHRGIHFFFDKQKICKFIFLFFFSEEGEISDTESICSEIDEVFRAVSSETMNSIYTALVESVDREGVINRLTPLTDHITNALVQISDYVQKK